jgi:hypothetical protein
MNLCEHAFPGSEQEERNQTKQDDGAACLDVTDILPQNADSLLARGASPASCQTPALETDGASESGDVLDVLTDAAVEAGNTAMELVGEVVGGLLDGI